VLAHELDLGDTPREPGRDLVEFPRILKRLAESGATAKYQRPRCVGEIRVRSLQPAQTDVQNMKAATSAASPSEAFLNAASPGVIALFQPNDHYKSQDDYLQAVAEGMRAEYELITASGLLVQIDAPDLAMGRHTMYRYFPAAPLPEPQQSSTPEHAQKIAGRYASSRRAETTFFRLFTLLGQMDITPKADGGVTVPALTGLNGKPKEWRQTAPFVWRDSGGPEQIAVLMNGDRVRMLGADEIGGIMVMLPVAWYQSGAWILPTINIAAAILVLTVVAWPMAAWRRRRRGAPLALSPRELSWYRIARVVALIDVVFLAGWMGVVSAGDADLAAYDGHLDVWFYVLHALGLLGAVGAIAAIWNGWLALAGKRGWQATTWNVGLAVSCVAVSWFAFAFHLIRFTLKY